MKSKIYRGQVRHRRMVPRPHIFRYSLFMMYLDLAELPALFRRRWFWSSSSRALARFRREDHLGDPNIPLEQCVRDLVEEQTGQRPQGPIRLLTQFAYFGFVFNPVSFYYCFSRDDQKVEAIVAEVNNTPWGERHCYVLPQDMNQGQSDRMRYSPEKVFHVSPFMSMDIDYDWRFNTPGTTLTVHMENFRKGEKVFDATLILQREEITSASLSRTLLAYPLMPLKIISAIYWEALRLWLKGTPVHDHPAKSGPVVEHSS